MIEKHLYRRTISKNGKKISCWYFWFWLDGKQVRRTCGKNGKPCLTKKEAMAYISSLTDDDLLGINTKKTLNDWCSGMYDTDSEYLIRQKNKGFEIADKTRQNKYNCLQRILEEFGDKEPSTILPSDIDTWLLSLPLSNGTRNTLITVFTEIFKELNYKGVVSSVPLITKFSMFDKKDKGVLTLTEINMLYPKDTQDIINVWGFCKYANKSYTYFQLATFVLVCLTTGLRSGEARALQYSQRVREDAFLINGMLDDKLEKVSHLKKGNEKNKKWRVVILPQRTIEMLNILETFPERKQKITDYIFENNFQPYSSQFVNDRFKRVLEKNGIDFKKRILSIHSCRFTYNTLMRREISDDDLRLMTGHVDVSMTDYYDRSTALDHLPKLLENKATIDTIFS